MNIHRNKAAAQVAPVYRITIGDIEVTALGDGHFALPIAMLPLANQQDADAIHQKNFLAPGETFEGSINSYLVNTGDSLTLIDAGARDYLQPTVGRLMTSFAASGYTPDQVDRIVLTHMHPDHIGGIMDTSGKPVFPNATLHVHAADYAFFLDPQMKAAVPPDFAVFFDCAVASTAAYKKKTELFNFGDDLGHGLSVIDMAGHTPGHSGFRIASGADELLVLGDIVHATALQFARPDWGIAFDTDGALAAMTRIRALEAAASDQSLIAGMHIPFRGIGHVSKSGTGYQFHPVPWSYEF